MSVRILLLVLASLAPCGCIGRSLVSEASGGAAETGCSRPDVSLCGLLAEPVPEPDVSDQRFTPAADVTGECGKAEERMALTDGTVVEDLDITCARLSVELEEDAVATLVAPHFARAHLHVTGAGHAELRLREPMGEALYITSEGRQLRLMIERAGLSDVWIDLDPDTVGTALHLLRGRFEGFAARTGQLSELRMERSTLSDGALDTGRLTADTVELTELDVVADDVLIVNSSVDDGHLQLWSGGIHVTNLQDTNVTGCGDLLVTHGSIVGGYLEGCSREPLQLHETSVDSSGVDDPVLLVGPVVVRDTTVGGAVIDGREGRYGLSFDGVAVRKSVLCEPSVINAEDMVLSCSVCAPDATFPVCAQGGGDVEQMDSDCPPFDMLECFEARAIMPRP